MDRKAGKKRRIRQGQCCREDQGPKRHRPAQDLSDKAASERGPVGLEKKTLNKKKRTQYDSFRGDHVRPGQ